MSDCIDYFEMSFSIVIYRTPEAVVQRCSIKMVLLKISQNSQENISARVSFLIKLQASGDSFPVNFPKFLRTPFFTKHLRWLLLLLQDHRKISNTLKSLGSFGNLQGKIKQCAQSCSPIKKKYSYLKADILNFLCLR